MKIVLLHDMEQYSHKQDKSKQVIVNEETIEDFLSLDLESECTEVYGPDMMNYVPASYIVEFMKGCVRLLRRGGKLVLGGTDSLLVCKSYLRKELNTKELSDLVYAKNRCNFMTIEDLSGLMQELGLKVIKKKVKGVDMVVVGERHE